MEKLKEINENFVPRKEKREFIATPTTGGEAHRFEAEYEEVALNHWQLVTGTMKDSGPVSAFKNIDDEK